MKEIKLSQGKIALVDDDDFEYLNQFKWHAWMNNTSRTFYAVRSIRPSLPQKRYREYMHRVILKAQKGQLVDHKDFNGLNNQKDNIRICTHSQNMSNSKPKGEIKLSGVTKNHFNYSAVVNHNNKRYYLGTYKTPEEAGMAYDKKAKELFGDFANLNFKD